MECSVSHAGEAESSKWLIDRWEGGGEEVVLFKCMG